MQKLLLLAIAAGLWINMADRSVFAGTEDPAAAAPSGTGSRACIQDQKPAAEAPVLLSQASTEIGPLHLSLSVRLG